MYYTCTTYSNVLLVKYILTECPQYTEELDKLNIPNILDAALGPNADTTYQIMNFLRTFELYNLKYNYYI